MNKRRIATLAVMTVIIMSLFNFGSAANTPPTHIVIRNLAYPVTLTELNLNYMNLTNSEIQVLSYMKNLRQLDIRGNLITDLTPISGLTNLVHIQAHGSKIASIAPLRNLTKLEVLAVAANNISDISTVRYLTKLKLFHGNSNNLTDVSALGYCTELTNLNVENNNISNISAFSTLTKLEYLGVHNNNISGGINFIANLDNLTWLEIYNNPINRDLLELIGMLLPPGCRYNY